MSLILSTHLLLDPGRPPTRAKFLAPDGVSAVIDKSFDVKWTDGDADMTGKFSFFFRSTNVPPNANLMNDPNFSGTLLPGGADITILDKTNHLGWDTSGVTSGTYWVYEVTNDPPNLPISQWPKGVVTVQHAGDARFPAVIVDQPDGIGDIVANQFALEWHAAGNGPLTATIQYAEAATGSTLAEVAHGVAMSPAPDGTFTGCYIWDLSALADGHYYYVQVTVTDKDGNKSTAFSTDDVVVYRDPSSPDAGPAPMCTAPPAGTPDAGTNPGMGGTPPAPGFCAVAPAGQRDRRGWGALPFVALAMALGAFGAARGREKRARMQP